MESSWGERRTWGPRAGVRGASRHRRSLPRFSTRPMLRRSKQRKRRARGPPEVGSAFYHLPKRHLSERLADELFAMDLNPDNAGEENTKMEREQRAPAFGQFRKNDSIEDSDEDTSPDPKHQAIQRIMLEESRPSMSGAMFRESGRFVTARPVMPARPPKPAGMGMGMGMVGSGSDIPKDSMLSPGSRRAMARSGRRRHLVESGPPQPPSPPRIHPGVLGVPTQKKKPPPPSPLSPRNAGRALITPSSRHLRSSPPSDPRIIRLAQPPPRPHINVGPSNPFKPSWSSSPTHANDLSHSWFFESTDPQGSPPPAQAATMGAALARQALYRDSSSSRSPSSTIGTAPSPAGSLLFGSPSLWPSLSPTSSFGGDSGFGAGAGVHDDDDDHEMTRDVRLDDGLEEGWDL